MSRSFERKLIYAASTWQIITGFITMFFYSMYIKKQGAQLPGLEAVERKGAESLFDSLYGFTVTYGLLFIVIGSLNILFAKKLMKDGKLQYKLPAYWAFLAAAFYFLSDLISLALCLAAAVIALAKNKPIRAAGQGSADLAN
ncbi:hypothetical protein [Bacillus sp. FJAT-27445]|uniref:hypothetical protein n=1 Tax=Bacillus sp. FJAT-27445 TaxID=1679166 RepID=UPI0007437E8A|nr:hypothetical protein [Bacillus sp. FJAT-27445]